MFCTYKVTEMKKLQLSITLFLVSGFFLTSALFAQEKAEITLIVKKDGKVVHDTTYAYDDAKKAKHVVKMAEAMTKEDPHGNVFYHSEKMHMDVKEGEHGHKMMYIYTDDEGMHKVHGDSMVWISKEGKDCEDVKVIKKKIMVSGDGDEEKHVYVIKSGGDGDFEITTVEGDAKVMKIKEEDGKIIKIIESEDGKEKKVEVMVIEKGEGDGEWTIKSEGDEEVVVKKKEIKEEKSKEKEKKKKQK